MKKASGVPRKVTMEDSPPGALTPRAAALGILLGAGVCLVSAPSTFYLHNTLLIGNHLPLAALLVLLILGLALNPALRRWKPSLAFSQGELLSLYTLMILTGA